jgi:hypothetical protein
MQIPSRLAINIDIICFLFFSFFFKKQNLRGEIEKVASFLGKSLTEEQLSKLTQHLRVDQFAKNEAVNYEICKELGFMNNSGNFIRKGIQYFSQSIFIFWGNLVSFENFKNWRALLGKTGDWKNHFSPELNARIDMWIESNLKGTDLTFITELEQQD